MNGKMTKKIIALMLASSMLAGMTACGNKQGSSAADNNKPTTEAEANKDGDIELNEPGQFPLVKGEPVTLRIFTAPQLDENSDFNRDKNEVTKWLEDKLNVRFKWDIVSSADKISKLNLLFTSNDYADIIFGSYWDGATQYMYGQQGKLVPLNKYYEGNDAYYYNEYIKAAKEINDGTVDDQILKGMVMPDGERYSIFKFNGSFHTKYPQRMWIYEPWLKAVGMEMPTTTDEFTAVLKAFKEKDPNGNGKADEIPLAGAIKGWNTNPITFLMNSFTYYGGVSQSYCSVQDGKVQFTPQQEGYKKGLEYLNSLAKQGLLLDETWTQSANNLKALTTQDIQLVGCAPGGNMTSFTNGVNRTEGDWINWKPVPPLKGPDGVQYTQYSVAFPQAMFNITDKCKYPKLAFRVGDALYETEISNNVRGGMKGKWWDDAKEGQVGLDGKPAKMQRLDPPKETNYAWSQISNASDTPGWHTGMAVLGDPRLDNESILYKAGEAYSKFAPDSSMIFPPLVFEKSEAKSVIDMKTAINEYLDIMSVQFITKGGIEEGWDAYVKELDNRGAKDIVKIYQAAYDKMKK